VAVDFEDYPAWLVRCLVAERLRPSEWASAERLCERFSAFGVELYAIGATKDPDGIDAYTSRSVYVASDLRQRTDLKGMYEALHRLCRKVAQAQV
jgi:hypothetical protein